MSNSARHSIRFSGAVYGASKGSYIDQCVRISIHMVTTVAALKVLVGWFTNMFTYIAGLTRVPWINNHDRDTIKQSLVLQKQTKLSKRPPSKFGSKLFVSSFRRKPNISQVFDSNTFTTLFSSKDNSFCNSMVHNACVSSFLALKPFGQLPTVSFSRTFRSVCLCPNRTPNLLPMFTVSVKPISRMLNTIRGYNDIRDSKIAPYKIIHAFRFFWGNFYGLTKEKCSFFVNQVRFSLDKSEMFRLMAHKINFLSTSKTPQRNHIVWFVGHNSSIISDGAKWFEFAFCFLVQGIRITNLGNRSYQHLRRKLTCGSERMIDLVVQFNFIENLFLPCRLRNDIAGSISYPHSLKEQCGLILGSKQLDFQSHFHNAKFKKLLSDNMLKKEKLLTKGITAFLPLTKKNQWVSAVCLSNYISTNHSKHYLKAHIILVTKYRKPLLINQLKKDMHTIFNNSIDNSDFSVEVFESDIDHVHFLIRYIPRLSISQIVRRLKQQSTYHIWQFNFTS